MHDESGSETVTICLRRNEVQLQHEQSDRRREKKSRKANRDEESDEGEES